MPLPAAGSIVGKYRLDRLLGQGGMGAVYEATHEKLGQRVAIKMLLPELVTVQDIFARFEREGRAAAKLRHRNSVRVIDVDQTPDGVPYIVMELLHGHDLESELAARGPLPAGDAVHFVLQAATAMIEAHANGTIHRDLKPSNLFLNQEADGTVCLKVLDFGISKTSADDVRVTSTQTQMGTPLYMSPEQVRSAKHVDGRSDIWSLGVILYELLAGEPPFKGSAAGIGAAIVSDRPTPIREIRSDLPEGLEKIVVRAMEKDPAARFATMQEFADALAPFSATSIPTSISMPILKSSPSLGEAATIAVEAKATGGNWAKNTPVPRNRSMTFIVVGIVAIFGIGGGAYFFSHREKTPAVVTPPVRDSAPVPPPVASAVASVAASISAPPTASSVAPKPSAKPRPKPTNNPDRL